MVIVGAHPDVTDFSKVVGSDRAPGLPAFDPNRAVRLPILSFTPILNMN